MLNSTECAVSPDPVVHHTKVVWYTAHKKIKKKNNFPSFQSLAHPREALLSHTQGWMGEGLKGRDWSSWFTESWSHWNGEPGHQLPLLLSSFYEYRSWCQRAGGSVHDHMASTFQSKETGTHVSWLQVGAWCLLWKGEMGGAKREEDKKSLFP